LEVVARYEDPRRQEDEREQHRVRNQHRQAYGQRGHAVVERSPTLILPPPGRSQRWCPTITQATIAAIAATIKASITDSPTKALLTALLFLVIQQLEGNFLQPAIQGRVLNLPSTLIFLAVIAGGQLAGLLGVIFAVPALAILKVLFDFFRTRLETEG